MHQTYSIFEIYNGNTSTKVGCQLIFISTIFVTILTYFDIGGFLQFNELKYTTT